LAANAVAANRDAARATRLAMEWLLEALSRFPGETWQQRWEAAGLNQPAHPAADLGGTDHQRRVQINTAAGHAFCVRLIQPSLAAFRSTRHFRYPERFRGLAADPLLEELCGRVEQLPVSAERQQQAIFDACCALTVFGINLADLTPQALLYFVEECRTYRTSIARAATSRTLGANLLWPVLYDMGRFPASGPASLTAARTRGQRTTEELVDRHRLRNREVRNLLVDYISRRSAELDYSTLDNLARNLVGLFWKTVEEVNPGQADLRLDEATAQRWKERLLVRRDGNPRRWLDSTLLAVRAFYLDLHTWSAGEPERWARWVAPCPIRDTDLRSFHLRRRRLAERMANRTRERQPLLPVLSQHVTDRWDRLRTLLEAARGAGLGERFVVDGTTWQRTATRHDREQAGRPGAAVRAVNCGTGEQLRLSHEEHQAFWQWAAVETLRLAGLRIEELCELTHLSARNYQRPNGEVVALLVVSPSKSDRERVIPMSAELFHVIAQVVRRHLAEHGTVPVCRGYDLAERTWTEPLPFLFQHLVSGSRRAMGTRTVRQLVTRAAEALIPTHPAFAEVSFSPHDFRRLLATELVNNGLPIHIGAALLGHLDLQTTRGYVAVFPEDVITHYQQFLARRRARRPEGEYRQPTEAEWQDFQEHFDKRKVELGSCGRPYGTPCTHEHACIRCPMLSVNPKMLLRLDELETDLRARRERAIAEGWQGEVDGLNLTLTFLRAKRTQARRAAALHSRTGTGPVMVTLGKPPRP